MIDCEDDNSENGNSEDGNSENGNSKSVGWAEKRIRCHSARVVRFGRLVFQALVLRTNYLLTRKTEQNVFFYSRKNL